jgi:hypothetical protein
VKLIYQSQNGYDSAAALQKQKHNLTILENLTVNDPRAQLQLSL